MRTPTDGKAANGRAMILFSVPGIPAPKGSTRVVRVRGRTVITGDCRRTAGWEAGVRLLARAAMRGRPPIEGPVRVELVCALPAPKRGPQSGYHVTRPDLDKLLRAVLDALTGVCYQDDGQVAEFGARKVYGPAPGAEIAVIDLSQPLAVQTSHTVHYDPSLRLSPVTGA